MKASKLPQHIAIIMDGNGRWATVQGQARAAGHRAGMETARKMAIYFAQKGVSYITIFGFSTENWKRPQEEIKTLNDLMIEALDSYKQEFLVHNIRFKHLGQMDKLPKKTQEKIKQVVEDTKDKSGAVVSVAFDYGSRQEIATAAQKLAQAGLRASDINEQILAQKLYTADMPDVDLLIRSGGEKRLSNFMLWQSAYAELYFSPLFWPDFDEMEAQKILDDYSTRERRFGAL